MYFVYVYMSRERGGAYSKLVVSSSKIVVNDLEVDLDDLESIEGEISEHIRVENVFNDRVIVETLPAGSLKFKLKNRDEIAVSAINPLHKVEDLVLKVNALLSERSAPRLHLKDSSTYKAVYARA